MALCRRSLIAPRRSSSAVGGMRYMSSYGRIDSVLSLGLPRACGPGRKGAAALVRGGHDNCTGASRPAGHLFTIGRGLREPGTGPIEPAKGGVVDLRADGTGDCETCRMPMFPIA